MIQLEPILKSLTANQVEFVIVADYFSEMIYPAECHSFVRPTSWTDEYTRILKSFERHLK